MRIIEDDCLTPAAAQLGSDLTEIARRAENETGFRVMLFFNPRATPYRLRLATTASQVDPCLQRLDQSARTRIVSDAEQEMKKAVGDWIQAHGVTPDVRQARPENREQSTIAAHPTDTRANGRPDKSLMRKAVSFTLAHFFGRRVPESERARRWAICSGGDDGEACAHFVLSSKTHCEGYCDQCGCGLKLENTFANLAAFEETSQWGCPAGKWKRPTD